MIPVLAFIGVLLAVWVLSRAVQQDIDRARALTETRLTNAQIASCRRVNELRYQFNRRGHAISVWVDAEIARASDPAEVSDLRALKEGLREVTLPNCAEVVRAGVTP